MRVQALGSGFLALFRVCGFRVQALVRGFEALFRVLGFRVEVVGRGAKALFRVLGFRVRENDELHAWWWSSRWHRLQRGLRRKPHSQLRLCSIQWAWRPVSKTPEATLISLRI